MIDLDARELAGRPVVLWQCATARMAGLTLLDRVNAQVREIDAFIDQLVGFGPPASCPNMSKASEAAQLMERLVRPPCLRGAG